jgi:hypothetical protein
LQHHLRLEHPVHQTQELTIVDTLGQTTQQSLVVHPVEELLQVDVHHDAVSFRGPLAVVWTADGLEPPPTRSGEGSG